MRQTFGSRAHHPCSVLVGNRFQLIRMRSSAPFPKFVIYFGTLSHELRKQRGTSKYMVLVPLFDLKFLNELAASAVGTSNRRHYCPVSEVRDIFRHSLTRTSETKGH